MLEALEITVRYAEREALSGVSLRAAPGEVTSVIGPNGAGKSTLMRTLNGAIQPSGGEVMLDGKLLGTYSRRALSRRIAVVAQEAELRFPVTVMEFVLGGRYAWANTGTWGWESSADLEAARDAVRETRMEAFAGR